MAVSEALERLKEMRKREGELIKESIMEIVNNIEKEFINLENRVDISYNNHINSIRERVKEIIIQNNIDDNKIIEQIIIYAQKSDIKEEVDRLRSHIIQFKETLKQGGIIGKKLDFLLQEMNRETNTILAKTEDFQIKTISVDLKTYIERLREQVQNIQ
jgi:uncharacterized protein (TIGR00255 family)